MEPWAGQVCAEGCRQRGLQARPDAPGGTLCLLVFLKRHRHDDSMRPKTGGAEGEGNAEAALGALRNFLEDAVRGQALKHPLES